MYFSSILSFEKSLSYVKITKVRISAIIIFYMEVLQ